MESTLLTLRIPDFEAAIRKAAEPGLSGRPVAIATAFKPLGRVVAACPQARAAGIEPEMSYTTARDRCPDAAFFLPDRGIADAMLKSLMERAGAYSPQVEAAGGGCVLLDTRGTERLWGPGRKVAERLQRDVRGALRLPIAAGLAVNRPWSRLASRAAGNDGICLVPPGGEEAFLAAVPASWIDGLTPAARTRLLELNVRSLGQLRQFDRDDILRRFDPESAEALWRVLHPHPWDSLSVTLSPVSVSNGEMVRVEAVLAEASVIEERLRIVARSLASQAAAALRARNLGAARLRLTLLHADGAIKTAHIRTGGYIQDEPALLSLAERLLGRVFLRRVRATRLWLTAEKLSGPERQGLLFPRQRETTALPSPPRARELLHAVDGIRERYGETSVQPAALLLPKRSQAG